MNTAQTLRFWKYHGLGNDFILFDLRQQPEHIDLAPATVSALCARRVGLGADGILIAARPATQNYRLALDANLALHIFNADGSRAQMCGNGLRCLARWWWEDAPENTAATEHLVVATDAGLRQAELISRAERVTAPWHITCSMGELSFPPGQAAPSFVTDGRTMRPVLVSVGNPHAVLVLGPNDDPMVFANRYGQWLTQHPFFPDGINAGFVSPRADGLHLVVHERGCGITPACGTGALAAAAVMSRDGKRQRWPVFQPGGLLDADCSDPHSLRLTGPAVWVAKGSALIP